MKVTSENVCIAPEAAYEILANCQFPNQRPASKTLVSEYAGLMRCGDWVPGSTLVFGEVREKGIRYLLNGGHRLSAVFESGRSIEFQEKTYSFTADEDYMEFMKAVYANEDVGKRRSSANIAAAYELSDLVNAPPNLMPRFMAAIRYIVTDFEVNKQNVRVSPQRIAKAVEEWTPEINKFYGLLAEQGASARKNKMYNAGVLALALYTLRHQPEKASALWSDIAAEVTVKGTTARTLNDFIEKRTVMMTNRIVYFRKLAHCWNQYFLGKDITMITIRPETKLEILGTPFSEKKEE